MKANAEFCELSQEELMMTEGGGILKTAVNSVKGALKNTLVWTPAAYMIKHVYKPIKVS